MRAPYLDDGDVVLHAGDCCEVMRELPADSVDAILTDPPYGLRFMGKAWDGAQIEAQARQDAERRRALGPHSPTRPGREEPRSASAFGNAAGQAGAYDETLTGNRAFQAWCETWAREALRVLKPGGYLLAFGGTRTYHRMACAIEDAGFEIRDSLHWIYGSGFPKSLDVSKAIDREAGAEREVVGKTARCVGPSQQEGYLGTTTFRGGGNDLTAPATPEAAAWQGWGTALKPSHEPVVVARKPLAERTVARQVLATGTGALNVDATRVETNGGSPAAQRRQSGYSGKPGTYERPLQDRSSREAYQAERPGEAFGRFPPNLLLTHDVACEEGGACAPGCPVGELDRQSGTLTSGSRAAGEYARLGGNGRYGEWDVGPMPAVDGDTGGASRFFPTFYYCPKASGADRGEGNTHPTVKPLALMRWLVRLVTPPGGTILEPFAGSGTTLLAAREEGLRAIGIEREQEYLALCAKRLRQLSLFAGPA